MGTVISQITLACLVLLEVQMSLLRASRGHQGRQPGLGALDWALKWDPNPNWRERLASPLTQSRGAHRTWPHLPRRSLHSLSSTCHTSSTGHHSRTRGHGRRTRSSGPCRKALPGAKQDRQVTDRPGPLNSPCLPLPQTSSPQGPSLLCMRT